MADKKNVVGFKKFSELKSKSGIQEVDLSLDPKTGSDIPMNPNLPEESNKVERPISRKNIIPKDQNLEVNTDSDEFDNDNQLLYDFVVPNDCGSYSKGSFLEHHLLQKLCSTTICTWGNSHNAQFQECTAFLIHNPNRANDDNLCEPSSLLPRLYSNKLGNQNPENPPLSTLCRVDLTEQWVESSQQPFLTKRSFFLLY
jgi:hypothetical protein